MAIPVGLSLFSFGYLGGFARRAHENQPVLSVEQLIALARLHGLAGIELPLARCFPGFSKPALSALRSQLDSAGLFLTIDAEVVDDEAIRPTLEAAAALGEPLVRAKLSKILGGNRYLEHTDPIRWFDQAAQRLNAVASLARALGLVVAIENHQDVTAEELVRLIRCVGEDAIGVNLDTGSTLATCESPIEFAQTVAPYVRNVHLKDYRLYGAPQGFRLVRCALGGGVVDLPGIFRALAQTPHPIRASIELGAVVAREVHCLNPKYWEAFPPRSAQSLVPFMRLLLPRLEPEGAGAWQTAWERQAGHEMLERAELEELFASVRYLASLDPGIKPALSRPLNALSEIQQESMEVQRR